MEKIIKKLRIYKEAWGPRGEDISPLFGVPCIIYRLQGFEMVHLTQMPDAVSVWLLDHRYNWTGWGLSYVKEMIEQLSKELFLKDKEDLSIEYIESAGEMIVKCKKE